MILVGWATVGIGQDWTGAAQAPEGGQLLQGHQQGGLLGEFGGRQDWSSSKAGTRGLWGGDMTGAHQAPEGCGVGITTIAHQAPEGQGQRHGWARCFVMAAIVGVNSSR